MPTDDPRPHMTAQDRKDWEQAKAGDRRAAERAVHNPAGRGSVLDVIEAQQRTSRERANEGGRER